jgi:hypothetical protein
MWLLSSNAQEKMYSNIDSLGGVFLCLFLKLGKYFSATAYNRQLMIPDVKKNVKMSKKIQNSFSAGDQGVYIIR